MRRFGLAMGIAAFCVGCSTEQSSSEDVSNLDCAALYSAIHSELVLGNLDADSQQIVAWSSDDDNIARAQYFLKRALKEEGIAVVPDNPSLHTLKFAPLLYKRMQRLTEEAAKGDQQAVNRKLDVCSARYHPEPKPAPGGNPAG